MRNSVKLLSAAIAILSMWAIFQVVDGRLSNGEAVADREYTVDTKIFSDKAPAVKAPTVKDSPLPGSIGSQLITKAPAEAGVESVELTINDSIVVGNVAPLQSDKNFDLKDDESSKVEAVADSEKDAKGKVLDSQAMTFSTETDKTYETELTKSDELSGPSEPASAGGGNAGSPVSWPNDAPSYDENRAMAGLFLGNPWTGGYGGANGPMGTDLAIKWRAAKTGSVTGFKWQNRRLRNSDVVGRAKKYRDNPAQYSRYAFYQKCVDNGLSGTEELAGKCAYTSPGGMYSVGNGGTIRVQVRKVNGNGDPDMSAAGLLGTSTVDLIPLEHPQGSWPKLTVDSPKAGAPVVAGNSYFFVLKNSTPPPNNQLSKYTIAEAKAAKFDSGGFSLNGVDYEDVPSGQSRTGPYISGDKSYYYSTDGAKSWSSRSRNEPWFVAQMDNDDNHWFGHTHAASYGRSFTARSSFGENDVENVRIIEGNTRGRQTYVPKKTFQLNGVWVHHGHYPKSSNGQSMTLQVKNSGGSVLASADFKRDDALYAMNNSGVSPFDEQKYSAKSWHYMALDKTVTMTQGQKYFAELSAPSGAGFTVQGYETEGNSLGTSSSIKYDPEQIVVNDIGGFAEASTNGGGSWGAYSRGNVSQAGSNQLGILFTTVGGPKSLK